MQRHGEIARRPTSARLRVLFIVPGHPSGADGITDYSFWLTAAAGRAGVECFVYALFPFDDKSAGYSARFPHGSNSHLTIKCGPAGAVRLSERLSGISSICEEFSPDWISLQFNPVNFREGQFFYPGLRQLSRIVRQHAPLALTAHESYRALTRHVAWHDRILNRVRQFEINRGLIALMPAKVFTSNPQHHADLLKIGLKSNVIPIISNIPRVPNAPSPIPTSINAGTRIALLFGRINPSLDFSPMVAALAKESAAGGSPITIVSIGEVGHRMSGWQRLVKAANDHQLPAHLIGSLSPREISAWMQHATYGLSHTPLSLWTKSSACAAMLAHGLPIIFPDNPAVAGLNLPPKLAVTNAGRLQWMNAPHGQKTDPLTPDGLWQRMALFAAAPSSHNS